MNITLKPNNAPKKPGFFVLQRTGDRPEIVRTWKDGRLYVSGYITVTPITDIEPDALWSDEITIEYEH